MAAYGALVSVMDIIEQIQNHPFPPISLDQKQVDSLTQKVTFLQDFLEGYSHFASDSKEADGLESRIADAAYAAEDVIESHIVDQILSGSTSHGEKVSSIHDFYQGLDKVIEDMDSIKKEMMEVKEKTGVRDQSHKSSSISAGSSRSPSTWQNRTMVGFDDALYEILDKLIGGQTGRQIIPIVGMGGIGKTTLARNIYENQAVVQHFDILTWVTISQEYRMREILLELLQESGSEMNEDELGNKLHKRLSGRRYLIIMDDIWNIEVWDQLKFFFPDNNNGSRLILTTRLSELASHVADDSHSIKLDFLDDDKSWNLFCKNVFGKEDCPFEFKRIGKEIVKNCKGLPLSIVVIGGLLAKSEQTRQHWEYIAENLNSIVNLEDNEHCLQILYRSYNSLPVHLKPCFLYMGVFREDSEIRVSELIKLWVAEGFLKSIGGRSLEEAAEGYLKELIDRNLILVHKWGLRGNISSCKIHDVLRDLCLREARKQKLFCVLREQNLNTPLQINAERRICIHERTPILISKKKKRTPIWKVLHALESASLARSLIWKSELEVPLLSSFRLLRLFQRFSGSAYSNIEAIFQLVNLRYLYVDAYSSRSFRIPYSVSLFWNLQTLIVVGNYYPIIAPSEIWKMPQLRHVQCDKLHLPDPPSGYTDDIVLENLQTLMRLRNLKCGEEVVKRIPNIKKLRIYYREIDEEEEGTRNYCFDNLGHLHKLESLFFSFECPPRLRNVVQNITFPHSLKKLSLYGTLLHWQDMTTKIGSLPLLEVLKLKSFSVMGPKWETVEGQFCSLKFLYIYMCDDLKYWTTDSTHFPRLEHLVLKELYWLKEIPSSIGDIPTLQSIRLEHCGRSAIRSAERIQEEQEELGNVGLQVHIR